jgi:hypothetical protein
MELINYGLFNFKMKVRGRDSTAYYSCDDHFVVVDKNVDYGTGGSASIKNCNLTKLDLRNRAEFPVASSPFSSSGSLHFCTLYFLIVYQ